MSVIDIILLVTGGLSIIVPIVILARGGKQLSSRLFALMSFICGTLWCFSIAFFRRSTTVSEALFWDQMIYVSGTIVPPLFTWFISVFPTRQKLSRVITIFLLTSMVFFLASIFFSQAFISGIELGGGEINQAHLGPIYVLWTIWFISVMVFAVFKLFASVSSLKGLRLTQARYILAASAVPVIGSLPFNVILPLFGRYEYIWIGPLSMILMFLIVGYAMVTQRLFGVQFILGNLVFYFLSGVISLGLIIIPGQWLAPIWSNLSRVETVFLWLFLCLLYSVLNAFLYRTLRPLVEKFFIFTDYNPYLIIERFLKVTNVDLNVNKIIMNIIAVLQNAFSVERIAVLLIDPETKEPFSEKFVGFTQLDSDQARTKVMRMLSHWDGNQGVLSYDQLISQPDFPGLSSTQLNDLIAQMEEVHAYLVMPLPLQRHFVGWLILGDKLNRGAFTVEDMQLLQNLTYNLAVALERALLYEQVENFAETLQIEVEKATKEVRVQRDEIAEQLRKERDMMDVLGHELRTPLSIAKNSIGILKLGLANKGQVPASEIIEKLEVASENLHREAEILETVLSSTKLETGQVNIVPEQVDCLDVVNDTVLAYQAQAKQKGLQLVAELPDKPVSCFSGRKELQEVLDNLVSNSIKYTEEGKVTIKLEDLSGSVRFSVIDTGIGIPADEIANLGKKFYRVDPYVKQTQATGLTVVRPGGTGIGLFVVFGLVKELQGTVAIASELGKGSTFTVTIPNFTGEVGQVAPTSQQLIDQKFQQKTALQK